ncbi:MAG: Spy/CpxP family protein refolding chaperone [Candidatus Electrothrix scaldis]|nr:MAG: Spy/CpxP family protein refolding chaperone [Candidatus Electrothrix sp. GW3-3]
MKTVYTLKKGRRVIALLLLLFFFFSIAGTAYAESEKQLSVLAIWQDKNIVASLELTPEQVKEIQEADEEARKKRTDLWAKMEEIDQKLYRILAADVINERAVKILTRTKAGVREKMILQMAEERLIVGRILQPEQKEKLEQVQKDLEG